MSFSPPSLGKSLRRCVRRSALRARRRESWSTVPSSFPWYSLSLFNSQENMDLATIVVFVSRQEKKKEREIERGREGRKSAYKHKHYGDLPFFTAGGLQSVFVLLCFVSVKRQIHVEVMVGKQEKQVENGCFGTWKHRQVGRQKQVLIRNRRIFLRNYFLIVVSCQSQSKPKGVLKTAFWKERTDCSHRIFSQSRLLKAAHGPSVAATPPPSQGLGTRSTYISQQLPWVPACPGAVWWQLMSAASASVPKEHLIPSAVNTGQWNHQHKLTHVNKDTAMPQSHTRKVSTKDSLQ